MSSRNQSSCHAIPSAVIILLILGLFLLSAGCSGQFEPASPRDTANGQQTTQPTTGIMPAAEQTAVQPIRNMPAELPSSGYIQRSYGYVPYSSPPNYRLTWIESNSKRDSSGNVIIYGRVKNEGPESLTYLQMTFNLFDSSGNLVGNTHAQVEYLGMGKIWRFESEPAAVPNYQYFELAGILAQ